MIENTSLILQLTSGSRPVSSVGKSIEQDECHSKESNKNNNSIIHNSNPQPPDNGNNACDNENGNKAAISVFSDENHQQKGPKTPQPSVPVLRRVGEKTPPGTLKKLDHISRSNSCKSWCEEYGQTFLAKTIDTPLPDPGPYFEDEDNSN